ncbi:MAG: PEGA domain-containing protein [candidate division Zixibacteria bacterium]|nr:PEGA domain-containing protein [candidate division Zixibacteria bacterium]
MKKLQIFLLWTILFTVLVFYAGNGCKKSTSPTPAPGLGSIAIFSTPSGATISLDGSATGKITPDTLKNVSAGNHQIKLSYSGYRDTTLTVSVAANATSTLNANLPAYIGTWSLQTSGTTEFLRAVDFVDANKGWVGGTNGTVLHTTDGGTTWLKPAISQLQGKEVQDLDFSDSSNGCILYGDWSGEIIYTVNGGNTWSSAYISNRLYINQASHPHSGGIKVLDRYHAWACGMSDSAGYLFPVVYFSSGLGYWGRVYLGRSTPATYSAIDFIDVNNGCVISGDYMVYGLTTTDGGNNWGADYQLSYKVAVDYAELGKIWSIKDKTLYGPGGLTYQASDSLRGLSFVNGNIGWAVGDNGGIYHTTNGGITWIKQNSGVGIQLNDISCVDATHCWAVGVGGVVIAL